ncbi:DUF4435 domain-containing protein [Microbacter margulisiae]|uniref:DUF4435 domain-containing protein n=1 Tax=Microbacter margulisiae TaxID=1350067 RepID=A0A7W5H2S1_9PORP|nr:DUF4435 domain-containing protein [Microbacter margulisiae]MBB3187682.1 hypothetical protein [Microbacter margulisiae]
MIPVSPANHYQYWAIHFAGEALQLHCVASIHVEDFDDASFWEVLFDHYTSNTKKFNFIYHSKTPAGKEATGVNHCLQYVPYLNKQFFICIDSDYRYLMQEPNINPSHFIFQTYTYSIENHYCYPKELNAICENATQLKNNIFDFDAFLLSYSHVLYETLIWHLYFLKHEKSLFSKTEFIRLISLQQSIDNYDINHNGQAIIEELNKRYQQKVQQLITLYPNTDIENTKAYYKNLGLHSDNAYLYVRGHNLYNLICVIGNAVDEQLLSLEKKKLNDTKAIQKLYDRTVCFKVALLNHIMFDEYPEIQKIGKEIREFFE